MMKLSELLSMLPFHQTKHFTEDMDIVAIEQDSRCVKEGTLFVCIQGFTVDGHDYIDEAIKQGARAIVVEKEIDASVPTIKVADTKKALAILAATFYGFPTQALQLIGITGTNGKTTTTYVLEKIFQLAKKKTGIIGTIQMKIGEDTYPIKNTTPDALFLQQSFKKMIDEHVDVAMMEVSSHALDLGRVQGCEFDVAIYTNLSQDHLDYHQDMDDYLRAKSLLFSQLGNQYTMGNKKFAIINEDDPHSHYLKKSTAQHILTYGCDQQADVMAREISLNVTGTSFVMDTPVGSVTVNSSLIGKFNVYNMLAASAAALSCQIPLQTIKEALESIKGVDGRFESVDAGQSFAVIVDYAHTPDSLENVLKTIREFAKRKVYVVVGCGGDRDRSKRPLMAEVAVRYADHAIFTSDNPRTEDPEQIIEDMITGLKQENFETIVNRKDAIYHAVNLAQANDVILIAGKGHETYQEIHHVRYDFDDRIVAKQAIKDKET